MFIEIFPCTHHSITICWSKYFMLYTQSSTQRRYINVCSHTHQVARSAPDWQSAQTYQYLILNIHTFTAFGEHLLQFDKPTGQKKMFFDCVEINNSHEVFLTDQETDQFYDASTRTSIRGNYYFVWCHIRCYWWEKTVGNYIVNEIPIDNISSFKLRSTNNKSLSFSIKSFT